MEHPPQGANTGCSRTPKKDTGGEINYLLNFKGKTCIPCLTTQAKCDIPKKTKKEKHQARIAFQTVAATTAPTRGATINTHNCSNAATPANNAGPILRAGFTEVPVNGIHTI